MDAKKKLDDEKKRKQREEDEKLEKRMQEQQEKMQREFEEEKTSNEKVKVEGVKEEFEDTANDEEPLANTSEDKKIPCFGVLGDLILSFSKLLNQKASHEPSGQYALNDEYYKRIEAIQFTMNHDDGNLVKEIKKSDIILLGVSRTSKTPTAIYLANKGFKTSNIPLVNENSIPQILKDSPKISCIVGLSTEPERLVDIRKNRMSSLKENENKSYTDLEKIKKEVSNAKGTFRKYGWPTIDVTRKSVEETAASVIKIYEIYKQND